MASYYCNSNMADQGAARAEDDFVCGPESLKEIIDFVGSNVATILFEARSVAQTTYTLTTSESVPSNITLKIEPGAIFDGAGTLTIDNPRQILAFPEQCIFGSSITVVFTDPSIVYPGWWHVSGTYAAAVVKANISGGGTLDFTATTYDLEGIAALDATITNDVRWISSTGQATLTNTPTEKLEFPTGINVHYDNLKFDTWWSPMDTYFTYDSLVIKNCSFNNVVRACQAWPASAYASNIGRVEITDNFVTNSENGFIVKSLVGSAKVSGNLIEDISGDGYTYGIVIGDHDNDTGTLQANTKNINISDNVIKNINTSGVAHACNGIAATGTNVVIADNIIDNIDGSTPADVEGIYTKVISGSITGNVIREIDSTSGAIKIIGLVYDEATNPKGDKLVVSNNSIYLGTGGTTCDNGIITGVPNAIISKNIIDGAEDIGIELTFESYNVSTIGNIITNTNGSSGITVWNYCDRYIISNNIIHGVTGSAGGASGIYIRAESGAIDNLTIRDNDIKIDALVADTPNVKGIFLRPNSASTNIRIINNDLKLTHDTDDPRGISFYSDVAIDGLYIVGNEFYGLTDKARAINGPTAQSLQSDSDYIANITNAHYINNFADLRLAEPTIVATNYGITQSLRIILDFSELDGSVGNHAIGETSDLLPGVNVIITRAWYAVSTVLGGAGADLGFSFPAAADYNILALEDISTSGTAAIHDTIVDGTLANFLKTDSPADISYNVADAEITSGVLSLFVEYVEYR